MQKHQIELPISQKPTDVELKKLSEDFREMPIVEILKGLKFSKNRWSAKDAFVISMVFLWLDLIFSWPEKLISNLTAK